MFNNRVYFFNENGEIKYYRLIHYFDSGIYGSIYKIDKDTCFKLINDGYSYDTDAIMAIRDLKLDNFYEIYDLLYDKKGYFTGYTMKYYDNNKNINVLKMPTEYTLRNFYNLLGSFHTLGRNGIIAEDLHSGNVILDKDKMTVIDVDQYYFQKSSNHKYTVNKNYITLLGLFRDLYMTTLEDNGMVNMGDFEIVNNLFKYDDFASQVEKKLIKYKYPIDYINDMRKRG